MYSTKTNRSRSLASGHVFHVTYFSLLTRHLSRFSWLIVCLALTAGSHALFGQNNPIVRFHTDLGDIDVELLQNIAPNTVANFLRYVNRGDYNNSFIHR